MQATAVVTRSRPTFAVHPCHRSRGVFFPYSAVRRRKKDTCAVSIFFERSEPVHEQRGGLPNWQRTEMERTVARTGLLDMPNDLAQQALLPGGCAAQELSSLFGWRFFH